MPKNAKMEIQNIAERILHTHGVDATKDFYLKISQPPYMDLVLERNGDIVLVGHYREENGDLISDPVLALEDMNGCWFPVRIEQWCGDTVCSFWEDGKLKVYPGRIKEFKSFQGMFAKNIREQRWLENGKKSICE